MLIIGHLIFGNHPKSVRLKKRAAEILKILKENGGKIESRQLEERIGISRIKSPSMFYKPLAAMRRWCLLRVHKSIIFDGAGKKSFKTEYELTPDAFYDHIQKILLERAKSEINSI
jgi:hypothetical protein